jgi:hypothetical protein
MGAKLVGVAEMATNSRSAAAGTAGEAKLRARQFQGPAGSTMPRHSPNPMRRAPVRSA